MIRQRFGARDPKADVSRWLPGIQRVARMVLPFGRAGPDFGNRGSRRLRVSFKKPAARLRAITVSRSFNADHASVVARQHGRAKRFVATAPVRRQHFTLALYRAPRRPV